MLYLPVIRSDALASRANLSDVAKLGRFVSGIRKRCWIILRSSLDITLRLGTFRRSESESAKLSPTQLNSALPETFSNGSTITVSAFTGTAWALDAAMARIEMRIANI